MLPHEDAPRELKIAVMGVGGEELADVVQSMEPDAECFVIRDEGELGELVEKEGGESFRGVLVSEPQDVLVVGEESGLVDAWKSLLHFSGRVGMLRTEMMVDGVREEGVDMGEWHGYWLQQFEEQGMETLVYRKYFDNVTLPTASLPTLTQTHLHTSPPHTPSEEQTKVAFQSHFFHAGITRAE